MWKTEAAVALCPEEDAGKCFGLGPCKGKCGLWVREPAQSFFSQSGMCARERERREGMQGGNLTSWSLSLASKLQRKAAISLRSRWTSPDDEESCACTYKVHIHECMC
jgi:hypothetical protein